MVLCACKKRGVWVTCGGWGCGPLTPQVTRRCRSQRRSSGSATSCPDPPSATSTCTATAPDPSPAPGSRPCSPPRPWSLTGSSRPLPSSLCPPGVAAAAAAAEPSAPASGRRGLSSPPPARSRGWRAAASRSAPTSSSLKPGSTFSKFTGENKRNFSQCARRRRTEQSAGLAKSRWERLFHSRERPHGSCQWSEVRRRDAGRRSPWSPSGMRRQGARSLHHLGAHVFGGEDQACTRPAGSCGWGGLLCDPHPASTSSRPPAIKRRIPAPESQ